MVTFFRGGIGIPFPEHHETKTSQSLTSPGSWSPPNAQSILQLALSSPPPRTLDQSCSFRYPGTVCSHPHKKIKGPCCSGKSGFMVYFSPTQRNNNHVPLFPKCQRSKHVTWHYTWRVRQNVQFLNSRKTRWEPWEARKGLTMAAN